MPDPNDNFIYRLNNGVGNSSTGGQYDNQNPAIDEDAVNGMIAQAMRTQTEHMQMVGAEYKSQNFKTGVSGWQIDGQGNAEFNNGTFRGTFQIGGTLITVTAIANLQTAINTLSAAGGGTVALVPATYNATTSFTIPSNVTVDGNGATIDFGGTANNFSAVGTNPYSTGGLTVNFGSTSVTGVGTVWTAGMVGQSILIGDYWYLITARASNTAITISPAYRGISLGMSTNYVIATIISGIEIKNITLQNNITNPLFDFRYVDNVIMDSLTTFITPQGVRGRDSANLQWLGSTIQNCTAGMLLNNVPYCILANFTVLDITGGTGIDLTSVTNTAIIPGSIQSVTGVGMKFTNCSNLGFLDFSIIECTSHGIEFVSGSGDVDIEAGYVNTCGGDGIKLTASSSRINIISNSILNNTGYGVNIANANDSNNNVIGNTFTLNTAGNLNDTGTATKIRGNQGVSDNIVEGDLSLTDITTNNATTSKHGFLLKLNNTATTYMDGTGAWSTPPSTPVIDIQTFNASGTWTMPANAKRVVIEAIGGGGGGGGSGGTGGVNGFGGGGGGGTYSRAEVSASQITSPVTITIAAAAAGGVAGNDGALGGNVTFGTYLTAYGGGGGGKYNTGTGAAGSGGGGGGIMGAGISAVINVAGAGGIPTGGAVGANYSSFGGGGGGQGSAGGLSFYGGGGGAGTSISGGASTFGGGGGAGGGTSSPAAGGISTFAGNGGAGGAGGTSYGGQNDGVAGTAPGGGGGGAASNTTTKNGGAGALGRITVTTYF